MSGSYSIGRFASGLSSGMTIRQGQKDRDADRIERAEDRELRRKEAESYGSTPPFFPEQGGGRRVSGAYRGGGGDSSAPYDLAEDPVAEGLEPYQSAFLNAISGGESGGRYNVRYTPQGGASFDGYDQHPGIFEPGPEGPSSAAGRYQFTKSTWDGMGGGAFTPARQDTQAWALASRDYNARTGRDLGSDLQQGGLTDGVMSALSPTWAALRSNRGRHRATYEASMARYAQPAPQAAAETAAAPVAAASSTPQQWGVVRRLMTT